MFSNQFFPRGYFPGGFFPKTGGGGSGSPSVAGLYLRRAMIQDVARQERQKQAGRQLVELLTLGKVRQAGLRYLVSSEIQRLEKIWSNARTAVFLAEV